jgi:hypothetical protein
MKEIQALHTHWLPLPAHYGYYTCLLGALQDAGAEVWDTLHDPLVEFVEWLEREAMVVRWAQQSTFRAQLAEADRAIDAALDGIRAESRAALHDPGPCRAAAANRILVLVKSYGNVEDKPYDAGSGDLVALLDDLLRGHAEDAQAVGLADRLTLLRAAVRRFEDLLYDRAEQRVPKPPYAPGLVRKALDDAARRLAEIIEAEAISIFPTAAAFRAVIEKLNPEIERLNTEYHYSKKDLSAGADAVIAPVGAQQHTGLPLTPVPIVYYRDEGRRTLELKPGTDFIVTYRNNILPGIATLVIHGQGKYRGQKAMTFKITGG